MTAKEIENIIAENFENGKINNSDMVEIVKLIVVYLNLKTVSNYAKANNMSYQGALTGKRERVEIAGVKFIIDNE